MVDRVEIRGGADEFEAAVIAVVLDHIAEEERAARTARPSRSATLPAWVTAQDAWSDAQASRWSLHSPRRRMAPSSGDLSR